MIKLCDDFMFHHKTGIVQGQDLHIYFLQLFEKSKEELLSTSFLCPRG